MVVLLARVFLVGSTYPRFDILTVVCLYWFWCIELLMCGFKIVVRDRPAFDSGEISCAVLAPQLERRTYPHTHVTVHVTSCLPTCLPSPSHEFYAQLLLLTSLAQRSYHPHTMHEGLAMSSLIPSLRKSTIWPSRHEKIMSLSR